MMRRMRRDFMAWTGALASDLCSRLRRDRGSNFCGAGTLCLPFLGFLFLNFDADFLGDLFDVLQAFARTCACRFVTALEFFLWRQKAVGKQL